MAWVKLQVGRGGVSGNPLGGATSDIQFDDVSAMAVSVSACYEGRGSTEEQWMLLALQPRRRPHL